jgi:dual 3',5'-cyclic-AMP and -GMP phosphodiesterase 11
MVTNSSILVDGDTGSVFVVEDRNNGGHGTLVSKVFDVHSGAHILPTPSSDGSITVPWGKGIIGYVAETRETINLTTPCI